MEESYYAAARRDTLQNILSYSLELKYLIIGHAAAVQGEILSLMSNMNTVSYFTPQPALSEIGVE